MSIRSRATQIWCAGWVVLIALQLGSGALGGRQIGSAVWLFWIVVVAASGCVATSLWLLWRAIVDDSAELGIFAAYAHGVSILPLVHGLTVPGVLYGDNEAVVTAALWALPVATIAAWPLVVGARRSILLRRWRLWVASNVVAQTALAAALLLRPDLLPFATMGTATAIAVISTGVAGSVVISARHLRLYAISRRNSVLAVSLSFAFIASASLVWVNGSTMTVGFWLAHALDIVGVLTVTIVGAIAYRRPRLGRDLFRPLTVRDPLDALEYGIDPLVRAFVADLQRKDPVTADHVRRTAETAMTVGEHLGLGAADLRALGLGALLHDIGKLRIDDRVLNKPDRLTEEEFEHMKGHAAEGAALVRTSVVLRDIAPIVRHHHERVDGRGYPDGLAGEAIPKLARIVSVCDAFDAMAHTRQYRQAIDVQRVLGILREHRGTQWEPTAVDAVIELVAAGRLPAAPTKVAAVGVPAGVGPLADCSCEPLPADRATDRGAIEVLVS